MTPEWSHIVRAHDVGGTPRREMLEADAAARAAVAARFDLLALERLTAAFELRREAGGVRVRGQVHGQGDQACVTTGEPVPFLRTEAVDLLLTEVAPDGDDVELVDSDLDIDIIDGDIIDLGEIAAQSFALGLDPYPRSPGAAAPGVISEDEARLASNPFAVLKKS